MSVRTARCAHGVLWFRPCPACDIAKQIELAVEDAHAVIVKAVKEQHGSQ